MIKTLAKAAVGADVLAVGEPHIQSSRAPVASKRESERKAQKARDQELVRKTLDGDRSAFQQLFTLYRSQVHSIAFNILKSQEDAEDVVQESFVKAYLALPKYRFEAAFYTWLFRIVYNMSIDVKRRINRKGGESLEFREETLNSSEISTSYDSSWIKSENPHEQLEHKQQLETVRMALSQLSEEHRAVLQMREFDGMSYDEIAEVTEVSKGTVMSRLHYARKAIQVCLKNKVV